MHTHILCPVRDSNWGPGAATPGRGRGSLTRGFHLLQASTSVNCPRPRMFSNLDPKDGAPVGQGGMVPAQLRAGERDLWAAPNPAQKHTLFNTAQMEISFEYPFDATLHLCFWKTPLVTPPTCLLHVFKPQKGTCILHCSEYPIIQASVSFLPSSASFILPKARFYFGTFRRC